jgi:hypothetical protein
LPGILGISGEGTTGMGFVDKYSDTIHKVQEEAQKAADAVAKGDQQN